MITLFLLLSFNVFAAQPTYWSQILEMSDQHEFYKNNDTIVKPTDSWQSLFGLVYVDRNLQRLKDCVYYRVPGIEKGSLKIKTISSKDKCYDHLLDVGDQTFPDIKSLQFAVFEKELRVDINYTDFKAEKWVVNFQSSFKRPEAKMHLSSAEFKSPKIILLAPVITNVVTKKKDFPLDGTLCHNINEDCLEVSPATCHDCKSGWYEIPNGCGVGPKFCGKLLCGKKGQPACRRGMVWQKKETTYECRLNSTFAYCSKGANLECDGKKAVCR